MYGLNGNP